MSQLDQILSYLDRDGVTEVILAVGQPIQFRRNGALVPLTNAQLTRVQISALIASTPLAAVFGKRGEGDIQLGKRNLRVTASGTADAPALNIIKVAAAGAPPPELVERSKRPSKLMKSERARTPSAPPVVARTSSKNLSAAVEKNRLTKSDIKFGPPPARTIERAPELDPPALDLGARAKGPVPLHLDLDDDGTLELGAPGAKPHLGSTPAAGRTAAAGRAADAADANATAAAFSGPPRTAYTPPPLQHVGSTPAIDAAFSGPPRGIDAFAGPPAAMFTPPAAFGAAPAPVGTGLPNALRALLEEATKCRASDLHLIVNRPACARVLGELAPLRPEVLDARAVEAMLMPLLDERGRAQLASAGYADLAIELPGGGRLRTNIARCQGGLRGTFRIARAVPPSLEELGLPKDLAKVTHHHQGLIVIAGPSGAGKTTTLSALVDLVNTASAFHIITVEDPIEIVYPRKAAVVSQREVGPHTKSFAAALKGSLREDPDVIVIGELRDRETVEIALTAAETGHLVLATMSTPSAAKTIDRLVDMFPPDDQQQVRASIAGALRAIVSQRLLPTTSGNVVAAVELLTGVLPLATMIREDKLFQLPSLMQRGRAFGMIRLDDSLAELVRAGKISNETALAASDNRKELATRLQQGTSAIPIPGRK